MSGCIVRGAQVLLRLIENGTYHYCVCVVSVLKVFVARTYELQVMLLYGASIRARNL